jgi:hypothetical protein
MIGLLKRIIGIVAAVLALTSCAQAQYVWHHYGGHEYALTLTHGTWVSHEAEAVAAGGHLVTINDAAENTWLASEFANTYIEGLDGLPGGAAAHIGYYYSSSSGQWKWISGEPVSYTCLFSAFPQGGTHAYLHVVPHPGAPQWNANPLHTEPGGSMLAKGIIERPAQTVATSNRSLYDPVAALAAGRFRFTVFGKLTVIDGDSFTLDDGSGRPVTVHAPGYSGLTGGDYARATGVLTTDPTMLTSSAAEVSKLH